MDGRRVGQGIMRFAGSDIVYSGEWLDSMRHGKGKLTYDKAGKCFYEGLQFWIIDCKSSVEHIA